MNETNLHSWREVSLWATTWQQAAHVAVSQLGPLLADLAECEMIRSWWFVRKAARWKIRYLPAHDSATKAIANALDDLSARGNIIRWAPIIYEPEVHAFGGPDGMAAAHDLFHADSRHVLAHLRSDADHDRELGLLLIVEMLRAADLDWYEQGHVWRLVTEERITSTVSEDEVEAVSRFLTADTQTAREQLGSGDWFAAFHNAGQRYAVLDDHGVTTRGLRAILAQHVLFAWNRLGLPGQVQGVLAAAAAQAVFNADTDGAGSVMPLGSVTVGQVTDPVALRHALVERIRSRGTFRTRQVETAFAAVPREFFLPEVDIETAYQPRVVVTKTATDGTAVSSASDPNLVATQAEDLDVRHGHKILEIGAATGINAALLAELVGPGGQVVTIEIDEDLTDGARRALAKAGYPQVSVICGDGAAGYGEAAPYDRIIVTAGAWDISAAWWKQLAVSGRLVVPVRLHGSGLTRSIAFDLQPNGTMTGVHARVCGFVPMRGSAAHAATSVPLTSDVTLHLDDGDPAALSQALAHPAHREWTGLYVGDHEPVGHLDLWLATSTGVAFGRLSTGPEARRSGLISPALRWAGACLYDGGTIAYLALREHGPCSEEIGVIAHGPDGRRLAAQMTEFLRQWSHTRPAQPTITAYPAGTPDSDLGPGTRVERPDTRLTIAW